MDILPSQDMKQLSIEQQAIQKCLPDILSIKDIVELWTLDKEGQVSIKNAMDEDIKKKALFIEQSDQEDNSKIHRNNFKSWLTKLRKKPINRCFHDDCLLANWYSNETIELVKTKKPLNTIHENDSFPFYEAYRELENRLTNLSYTEFGLFVFDSDIRIFEKSPDNDGNLKQLSGCWELNEVGTADSFSSDVTPLHLTLTRFRYAMEDIERLTPEYRYICFDDACKEIAYFANKPEEEIKPILIRKAEYENIYPHHPYCGFAHPEQENLWPSSAYPDYTIAQILRDDFGISEYGYAFDAENYLDELKEKGNSDNEIKRIRNVLNARLGTNSSLIEKQNAIAEIAALRPGSFEKYAKPSNDLIKKLKPLNPNPCHEDRVTRFVWLSILNRRKEKIDKESSSNARTKELDDLNHTITDIEVQLGYSDNKSQVQLTEKVSIVDKKILNGKSKIRNQSNNINDKFTHFKNLRTNQISLVMMEGKAKITIEGNTFDVLPVDIGLKAGTQSWKLLEGAAISSGDLTEALKKLNRTSDREKETAKIKTAICRLRQDLKSAMGLEDSPIINSSGSYRFTFKVMTHEMLKDSNVSKGADAMDYTDFENLDDNKSGRTSFYSEEPDY